ncbi:sulfate ABC transporter substrate-binding protein [Nocardioides sp.]|uniref:sulfate ABC transporter substrate-binding protein n=1 Tax=Nocardioides sp. TaxID=35761 RepID=UPI003562DC26
MTPKSTAVLAASLLGISALAGCAASGAESTTTVRVVGYSVLQAANESVLEDFLATDAGAGVRFTESYGASGDQSRAVLAGQPADEVHLSLEPDVTKLVDDGLVAADWKDNATRGICTQSIVVMVVRPGNPQNISTWSDLVEPGVEIVTPNPASSGSAKWNLLAAYGSVLAEGGSEAEAQQYLTALFAHAVALPDSGRDATTAFTGGTGDVLLSYENEAILARQSGADFDYVVPESSILIQNPCAVTVDAPPAAQAFLEFQKTETAQQGYAQTGYRPLVNVTDLVVKGANDERNPFPEPKVLLTVDQDFGGWADANVRFFDAGKGIITMIQAEAGR